MLLGCVVFRFVLVDACVWVCFVLLVVCCVFAVFVVAVFLVDYVIAMCIHGLLCFFSCVVGVVLCF